MFWDCISQQFTELFDVLEKHNCVIRILEYSAEYDAGAHSEAQRQQGLLLSICTSLRLVQHERK